MRKTDNYKLVLYELNDKMSITASQNSLNATMEIIDSTLKEKATINDMTNYIEEHKDELKGADGINGKDGYTPIKGVDYFDGINGVDGYTPIKGVDYFDGEDGIDGKDYVLTETDKEDISKLVEVNIPTKVSELENDKNYLSSVPIEYVTEDELTQKQFATESYVANKIAEAELSGSDVDLSGYATKDEVNAKVDKVKGKSLIEDSEIARLANVVNYDDTSLKNLVNSKADKTDIPTKVSELDNDKNYITSIPSEYITESELNSKGYLTEHQDISNLATKSEVNKKADASHTHSEYLTSIPSEYITETELDNKGYLTQHQDLSSYAKTTDIPTKVSDLTNDKGYLTSIPSEYITETELNAKNYAKIEEVEEIAVNALGTETLPSPNIVNINDTESWPFGISETEAIKGLYSWIDSEGYINIRGTATENCSLFLMFEEGDITFEAGTYYIGFDDMLRTGTQSVVVQFNDNYKVYANSGDESPTATITLTENLTVKKIDLVFNSGAVIDFRGHCWITKDEPIDFYVPKGGSYKIPITPAKREDFEKLDDYNVLGIFDSIGGVGDSLTSGYINPTSDDVGIDTTCYPKSWLTQLKKITGIDITHYSYQGATAKNWMQNQNSFYEKIIETPHEAYFLALGTNDSSDWSGYGLGTIADMGTDTESFYGWYSKVIARIRTANPKAPIFMLSMYWTGFPTYNQAIQEMANATENAYYIDITDMNDKYSQYRQGYHFNSIGYYYIAQNIVKRTSNIIIKNHQDFANLGVNEE